MPATPKPNPVFYLVSVFFGFLAGMNSHGSWLSFIWIVVGFVSLMIVIKIIKYAFNIF